MSSDLAPEPDPALVARSAFALYYFALISWLGAGLVTGHFLRQTRPTET